MRFVGIREGFRARRPRVLRMPRVPVRSCWNRYLTPPQGVVGRRRKRKERRMQRLGSCREAGQQSKAAQRKNKLRPNAGQHLASVAKQGSEARQHSETNYGQTWGNIWIQVAKQGNEARQHCETKQGNNARQPSQTANYGQTLGNICLRVAGNQR